MPDTGRGSAAGARRRRLLPTPDPEHRYPRVTSARVLAGVFDVVVGLRLLAPDGVLGSARNPNFRLVQAHFHADWVLGLLLLALGAVMVVSLYTDRFFRATGTATWLAMLVWVVIAADVLVVNAIVLGPLAWLLVAVLHAYAYAHLLEWREQQRRFPKNGRRTG